MSGLAEEHFPLVFWVVHDMTRTMPQLDSGSFDDLVSCASVALVEVAERYDPNGGAAFSTYARSRLRGAVLDEMRRSDWASRSVRNGRHRLLQAASALSAELGREPTDDELAQRLDLTMDQLERLRADVHRASVLHLEGIISQDGDVFDLPGRTPGPEQLVMQGEDRRHIRACVDALPSQHREVLTRHFFGDETLTVIAADMGLALARVSQIKLRGLALLHAALAEVWDLARPATGGGVRARNEQQAYLSRAVRSCSGAGKERVSA